jgi:hypothetical protein
MKLAELLGALPGVDPDYGLTTLCFGTQPKASGEGVDMLSSRIVNSPASQKDALVGEVFNHYVLGVEVIVVIAWRVAA